MIKLITLSFLFIYCLSSCNHAYDIQGISSIRSLDGYKVYINIYEDGKWKKVDSTEIVHGKFSMKGEVDSVMFATLFMGGEAIMPVILEKGKINVRITDNILDVKGTHLNNALHQFFKNRISFEKRFEEIHEREYKSIVTGDNYESLQKTFKDENEAVLNEMNDYMIGFIKENYENVIGPNMFMFLCSSLPYPVINQQIEEIIKDAPSCFVENQLVKEFMLKANQNMKLIYEHQSLIQN